MNDQPPNAAVLGDAVHREWISRSCANAPNYEPNLLDQLIQKLGKRAWYCAFHQARQFAPQLAEVIADDAFQRVCVSILECSQCQNLPEKVPVSACLCVRAKREAINLLRTRNILPAINLDAIDEMMVAEEDDEIAVWLQDLPYDQDAVLLRLQSCFGRLNSLEVRVLRLMYFEGQSASSVAEQFEDALKTQQDSEDLEAGRINNAELDKRLGQRVYRLRDRALNKIKNCMLQCQDKQP